MRTLALLSVPAVLALAVLAWFQLSPFTDRLEQAAPEDPHRRVIEDTLARTLRESRSGVTEVKIQAPPAARPDPGTNRASGPSETPTPQSRPTPPEGYEFVSHQGGMKRAPLPARPTPEPSPNPAWLDPSTALDELSRQAQSNDRNHIFAAARMAPGAQHGELAQSLATLGAELEGTSGEYARVRVPANPDTLKEVNALPGILGLGAMPAELKVAPEFATRALNHPSSELVPVFITLMADDPSGELRQPLASFGVTTGAYDPALRTYTANMPYGALAALAEADFVMAVEPIAVVQATHDTSIPVMGADALRQYQYATSQFTGITGQGIPIAVMDTGLNTRHMDINTGRSSICGANFISMQQWDLWADIHGHGTHVTGTIAGAGKTDPLFAGMAPNASHIRFAKVLHYRGFGSSDGIRRGMNFLSLSSACRWNGQATASVKPLIVNMSLAARGITFSGRGVGERKLDSIVHANNQLYVVAQANSASFGFSNYGTAKNSLAVGAVDDTGIIAPFSSHGPTADNRLAPSVVGTGVNLSSAMGAAQPSGYITFSGTSMASPSVAGVATLLMEAEPDFRERPALTRARLMASAIRPDAFLESPDHFPRDNTNGPGTIQHQYGMGLVSARASVLTRDTEHGWVHGSATSEPTEGSYEYVDITVPEGASRLDIVMTWDEQPADTLTKSVLNNLDLWVDKGADCTEEPCGEYSSLSKQDSVEWLLIDDPAPGTYRVKIQPTRLYGEEVKAAVAWTLIRGDATPLLSVHLEETNITANENEEFEVLATVSANQYLASGTTLHLSCRNAEGGECYRVEAAYLVEPSRVSRGDGLARSLPIEREAVKSEIPLGEIAAGEERQIRLKFYASFTIPDSYLYLTATAWNARADAAGVRIRVTSDSSTSSTGASATGSETGPPNITPPNDEFANASPLSGARGSVPLDLLAASREPGEQGIEAKSRTLWYTWTAPSEGLFRFRLIETDAGRAAEADFNLYTGDELVALSEQASKQGSGLTFSANEGQVFRLRVGTTEWHSKELVLQWESADVRPANDDFAFAEQISGETGEVSGSNEGGTLERSEFWGGLVATVWYEWTAPADGHWQFSTSNTRDLMIFVGTALPSLRLVSYQRTTTSATVPVAQGETYRIAIASNDADDSGSSFTLTWRASSSPNFADVADNFQNAIVLEGLEGRAELSLYGLYTVEPFEPPETGIASLWWQWTAPEDGTYTWRFGDYQVFWLSAFSGESLEILTALASGSGGAAITFEATAGTTYRIALGRFQDSINQAYRSPTLLEWGRTPENDNRADAVQVFGASGTATKRFKFATAESDEPSDHFGYESVWWRWSTPSSGWYRFWVEENLPSVILSLYPVPQVGAASNTSVASSERTLVLNGRVEAHLLARAGDVYEIRLSYRDRFDRPDNVSFAWESTDPPEFLQYVGAVTNQSLGVTSRPLSGPRNLTVHSDGSHLFAGSTRRLLSLKRDQKTGWLSLGHRLDAGTAPTSALDFGRLDYASLLWSEDFGQLLTLGSSVYSFELAADGSSTSFVRELTVNNHTGGFPLLSATNSDGSRLYFLRDGTYGNGLLQIYRVDSERELTLVQTLKYRDANGEDELLVPRVSTARAVAVAADDSHVYLLTYNTLLIFSSDSATGKLSLVREILGGNQVSEGPFKDLGVLVGLALDPSGKYLFVTGYQGPNTALFDLSEDASNPKFLDSVTSYYARSGGEVFSSSHLSPFGNDNCPFAVSRSTAIAVDKICSDSFVVVRWDPASEKLEVTDFATPNHPDRFGKSLESFTLRTRQIAQSPDGAHIYLATNQAADYSPDAIHVFGRASAMTVDDASNHSPSVNQALSDQVATVGQAYSYQFAQTTFDDADGDTLIYSVDGLPQWLAFDAVTRTISGTPVAADVTGTPISIGVTATDGNGGSAQARFDLTVLSAESDSNPAMRRRYQR